MGFDVDLANALCKEMNATCTFTNQAFDSLIPSLKFRRFDAVMAGMDITPERENRCCSASLIMKTPRCLSRKRKSGGCRRAERQTRRGAKRHHASEIPDRQAERHHYRALRQLSERDSRSENGRIEAVFGDTAVVNEWLKQNPNRRRSATR